MIGRRQLLGTSVLGGLFGTFEPAQSAAAQSQALEREVQDIAQALRDLRKAIDAPHSFSEILGLRQRMTDFLRVSGKFPDFIEVSSEVWWNVYDWHIKHLQPTTIGRDASGRYTITLVQTTLIMRVDMAPNSMGQPFDLGR